MLALESVNAMGKGTATAVAGTTAVGSSVEPITVDADWRAFIHSEAVNDQETIIKMGLDADTVVHTPLIIKVTRCKMPVIMQLLHTRTSRALAGSSVLSRVPSMKPMANAAISFYRTSDPDKDDPKKLTQIKGYTGFIFSNKMFTNMIITVVVE